MLEPLPPLGADSTTDRRLFNWGRWARSHGCATLCMTGIIASRAKQSEVLDDEPKGIPIDTLDALKVERAWVHLAHVKIKHILVSHYVLGTDYRTVCREYQIPFKAWNLELSKAVTIIKNRLSRA